MSDGWSKSDYLAAAYVWLAERKLSAEHADSLVEVLKKAHATGKASGVERQMQREAERIRLKQMHDAAWHRDSCYDEGCLGQCRER